MGEDVPLEDPIEEGKRVIEEARERDLTVRLMGGTAIWHLSETQREKEPFKRDYRDVDFVGIREDKQGIIDLMTDLGYLENERFNTMHRWRLEFFDEENERKTDYIIDKFQFCHEWDLRDRVKIDDPTVPIEDLLLSKMQIVEISDRDVRDTIAMLNDYPIEKGENTDHINSDYIAELCSKDWGLYTTINKSIDRVKNYLANNELPIDKEEVQNKLDKLRSEIEERPKSMGWKLRSIIGERMQWYDRPELT